jgi:phosphoribosylamine--glycine ligase
MRVLLVGHGGRECALAWRIAQSPTLTELVVCGPNPGWPDSVRHVVGDGPDGITAVAAEIGADLVVVGPEAPLAAGAADALKVAGIPCFGPVAGAALLESSKAFAKDIMQAAGVPTAAAVVCERDDPDSVRAARARCDQGKVVVKADGLAAGKGVVVCQTAAQAHEALDEMLGPRFGDASARIVLEDLLIGPEVSVFSLCDGTRAVSLPSSQDHKTLLEGGRGPNTGGMGAYAPCPLVDDALAAKLVAEIHTPVIAELARRGHPFRGVLYCGLMMTADGPQVLEFNVRFGDPECQALMCLWDEDVLPWLLGAAKGALPAGTPSFSDGAACCVVLASAGYPISSDKGQPIPEPASLAGVVTFHAGTRRGDDGVLRTNGGRVLGVTGVASTLREATDLAYGALDGWRFPGAQSRGDIAASALEG